MHIKTLATAVILGLSLCSAAADTLSVASRSAVQRATQHKRKKVKPMLELPSPNKNLVVVLSDPLPYSSFGEPFWRKIVVKHKSGAERFYVEVEDLNKLEGSHEAFLTVGTDRQWSPDGRYLVVTRASDTSPSGEKEDTEYEFLDLCTGGWVYFRSKDGEDATITNFRGWRKDQPHTMLILHKNLDRVEAFPVPESESGNCGS